MSLYDRFICKNIVISYIGPMLVHGTTLVSFGLFRKNLGNLREFFGQMVHRPPWQKIARTPMRLHIKYRDVEMTYYSGEDDVRSVMQSLAYEFGRGMAVGEQQRNYLKDH